MANNVNQIARKANAAGYAVAHRKNTDMVTGLDKVIK
ncbi:MAG: plasmid mobilization relaxosome protein MobC, partial [Tannerella sp.]|nr:plasmid mobilization relaxosome protein MobC [Tannerella sp.]